MTVKRERVTDGVLMWDELTFDISDLHPSDIAEMKQMVLDCAPESRIQKLEAFAESADLTDDRIAIRIEQLREHLRQATRFVVNGQYDRAELAMIALAESVRRDIEILPLTLGGIKHRPVIAGGEKARENRALGYNADKDAWRAKAKEILASRTRKPSARELARLVAKQLSDSSNNDEKINQLADSRRKWIADLL